MTITAGAADLARGYEALRAQALGEIPAVTPRGRAVLAGSGLAAWMAALAPARSPLPAPAGRPEAAGGGQRSETDQQGAGLLRLLAEMVLASQKGCPA